MRRLLERTRLVLAPRPAEADRLWRAMLLALLVGLGVGLLLGVQLVLAAPVPDGQADGAHGAPVTAPDAGTRPAAADRGARPPT